MDGTDNFCKDAPRGVRISYSAKPTDGEDAGLKRRRSVRRMGILLAAIEGGERQWKGTPMAVGEIIVVGSLLFGSVVLAVFFEVVGQSSG